MNYARILLASLCAFVVYFIYGGTPCSELFLGSEMNMRSIPQSTARRKE